MRHAMKRSYRDDMRLFPHRGAMLAYVALAVGLLALPGMAGNYMLSQATFVFVNGTVAVGLMLLIGFTGQISLGHAAFFSVGAYVEGVLLVRGVPFPLALLAAGVGTGAVGVVVGLPALRMRGIYLAMATLAFAFIVEEVIVRWSSVTRGNRGLNIPDPVLFGHKLGSGTAIYYLALAVFAVVLLAVIAALGSVALRNGQRMGRRR